MKHDELIQLVYMRVFQAMMEVGDSVHMEVTRFYPGQWIVEDKIWNPLDNILFAVRDQIEGAL